MAQAVAELIAQGLVVERRLVERRLVEGAQARVGAAAGGALRARRGRPTSVLELARQRGVVLACDIGHRHITVATCDLQGRILAEQRVDFPVDDGAAATFREVHARVAGSLAAAGASAADVLAFGVSFPYPVVRATGAVRAPAALAGWQGVNVAEARPAGIAGPIVHDNDANFGAWGERMHGASPDLDNLLYVKLSDGIGAGLIVDGVLLSGARGIGGEMGHLQVDPNGPLCRCGRRGCLETVVAESLPDLYSAGTRVGHAIAQLCAFIDPEVVVLGGRLGAASAPLVEGVREAFAEWMPGGTASGVDVRPASLGARSELLGIIDRTLTAAWASGAVGRTGTATADPFSSCRRTNSRAVLDIPFDAERLVVKE